MTQHLEESRSENDSLMAQNARVSRPSLCFVSRENSNTVVNALQLQSELDEMREAQENTTREIEMLAQELEQV